MYTYFSVVLKSCWENNPLICNKNNKTIKVRLRFENMVTSQFHQYIIRMESPTIMENVFIDLICLLYRLQLNPVCLLLS